MSYETQQNSQYGGEPITLFHFASGARSWLYCNQRESILRGSDLFIPLAIKHGDQQQNLGEPPSGLQIMLPANSPIAAEFRPYLPPEPITLRVYTRHRTDSANEYVPVFLGECASVAFDATTGDATITCMPITHKLERAIPWPTYCSTCNWAVYSSGCGVDRELFKTVGTTSAVNGVLISSAAFGSKPDGWFTSGYIVRDATGEIRWIENHVGDVITVSAPFLGLGSGESFTLFAGCDGLESTCSVKFNNLPRFAGFPDMPRKNPFSDNVLGTNQGSGGAVSWADAVKLVIRSVTS